MNLIEMLIIGAVVQLQDQIMFRADETSINLIEAGDRVITQAGLGPNDWPDTITVKAPGYAGVDYLHISRNKLN